ncbi:sigma-54 dependent transcriptional regulator [Methylocaldum sp.]|uniref:sigma-54 dependent transcriptional regulator n=1 Tax=Methylocaldum sp. TaxID=1969727 RepID=UPI002D21F370|nr:sigma-54 dependent transcriptional regulator [Methylocaldum sp.]HYE35069.1 sigma-54 dependent transcriptional regulator [Methylocaldum sp.]
MERVSILYLAPKAEEGNTVWPLKSVVKGKVHITSDPVKARNLISTHKFDVGLVQFEPFDETFFRGAIGDIFYYPEGSSIQWVALVSSASMQNEAVCQLIAEYFHDYHTLPFDADRLRITLGHASGMAGVKRRAFSREDEWISRYELIGSSPAMMRVLHGIDKVLSYDLPVLITGESGTGKELAALAIHNHSPRADGPFVAVNCAALPPNLIQSELFGYEKGAFTGAHQRKPGLIEKAGGGTLFLDEMGELPLDLQANLLRFLQQKTIYRVGGHEEIAVDVRIISATHVDLEEAVREGRFREDLYYRLNVLRIPMPPLRERAYDIEVLAEHFLNNFKKENACKARQFSRRALKAMRHYSWPGNVRELKNRVERALVMCEDLCITPVDLGLEEYSPQPFSLSLKAAKEQAEKDILNRALAQAGDSVLAAARLLGVSHVTLYRLIKKHAIKVHK